MTNNHDFSFHYKGQTFSLLIFEHLHTGLCMDLAFPNLFPPASLMSVINVIILGTL